MGKKFVVGLALGSLASLTAWSSLDQEQQKKIKAKVRANVYRGMDVATDYTLDALDIADTMMHDYGQGVTDKFNDWVQSVKEHRNNLADHFVSDDFDQQTADIRDALQKAGNDDSGDDIIIDQTNDQTDASHDQDDSDGQQSK